MSKSPPSNLEDHLGYWLRCLSNSVSHSFANKLAKLDVSVAQWVVMRTLYGVAEMTLNQAAQKVGVDKSSLSRMAERLVQRGLIERSEGNDRRSIGLALTSAGTQLVIQMAKLADENDQSFFHTLSLKQREEFLKTIQQLLTANGWESSIHGKDKIK